MAAINANSGQAGIIQGIGWISGAQVGILSSTPIDRTAFAEGFVVGLQIQGISKAVHFDTLGNANAFITLVKAAMV